jgi:hypothetical protein
MLTNGRIKPLVDPDSMYWQQWGHWRLYGITLSGNAVAMQTPVFHGEAKDANTLAYQIARDKNYRGYFLYELK